MSRWSVLSKTLFPMNTILMKLRFFAFFVLLLSTGVTRAQDTDKYAVWGPTDTERQAGFMVRLGYVIGGTTPVPLPAEIRSINAFHPFGGISLGADAYWMLSRRWGVQVGWHFFYEGFHTSANVKNYFMGITKDGNYLEGYFTGVDETDTKMFGATVPLTATFRLSPRWNVSAGPFVSMLYTKRFEGEVYDGYLREGNPTGQKIEMTKDSPATYDFQDDMLNCYWGVELMFDWKAMRHMNVFGGLDWACSSIFPSSFKTVHFKMFPLYAKLGIAYRY